MFCHLNWNDTRHKCTIRASYSDYFIVKLASPGGFYLQLKQQTSLSFHRSRVEWRRRLLTYLLFLCIKEAQLL
jgi:hypothetical protein